MNKLKILYFSPPHFLDCDLCFLQELGKRVELYYVLDISVKSRKANILEYSNPLKKPGIFSFNKYSDHFPQFYTKYINYKKSYFINRISSKSYHISNIKLQFDIFFFIKDLKSDIIHYNNSLGYGHYLPLFLIKKKCKVLTIHDPLSHSGEQNKKSENIKKFYLKHVDSIILLNSHQKEQFSEYYGISPEKIFVSRLGIYNIYREYLKKSIKDKNIKKNSLLFFGRISPYKGIEYLIKAAKIVKKAIPDLIVTIAGKGNFYFNISDIKNDPTFNIINRHIENEELVELISTHSVVVCPYTDATQSGVIMTAYAFNKPVIATSVGGIPEMVDDNITGKLVPPKNSSALAKAIIELLQDKDKLAKMSKNIEKTYCNGKFSWENIAKQTLEVYKTVLGN